MIVRKVKIYVTETGIEPMYVWIKSLDKSIASRIYKHLEKIQEGKLRNWKSIGNKLFEERLTFGAGYRIYIGKIDNDTIILLNGGTKSRQQKDIELSRRYLLDYTRRFL